MVVFKKTGIGLVANGIEGYEGRVRCLDEDAIFTPALNPADKPIGVSKPPFARRKAAARVLIVDADFELVNEAGRTKDGGSLRVLFA